MQIKALRSRGALMPKVEWNTSNGGGGSSSENGYSAADGNTQAQHQEAIEKLKDSKFEDGTYDLDTFEAINYDGGYQVTFCQIGDNYSDTEYADKVNEFLAVSSDGKTLAGKFESTPEISFNVSDLNTAVRLAEKYNQISIWDWNEASKTGNGEIKTGGTGKRK